MDKTFHSGNRERLYGKMKENSILLLFSGTEVRKTNDEYYPFYTDRNFLYLTGLDSREFILAAAGSHAGALDGRTACLDSSCTHGL